MPSINKTKILKNLANLQLSIGLLITIGFMIALGTIIEQDQSLNFYKENYPEASPLFGFLSWKVITILSLDKIYTAWWFVVVLLLFGSSLRNFPLLKLLKFGNLLVKVHNIKNLK